MKRNKSWLCLTILTAAGALPALADDPAAVVTNQVAPLPEAVAKTNEFWNWHIQNTDILDAHPSFPARYSGPSSLNNNSEIQETVSLDLFAGVHLWPGGEFHVDGLMWQGFGFSQTRGIENFPNAEAYRVGTKVPNVVFARVFYRQVIGFGGDQETIADDQLHLASQVDVSRLTLTAGKFSSKDIFDNNAYANDGRSQFMSWGFVGNEAWDYPADSLGYITGFAAEFNQPQWTLRYGFFQVPEQANGVSEDGDYLKAWGMVAEYERRYTIADHPGSVRALAYLNRARMGSYEATVDNPALNADITQTQEYRSKIGFGLNADQEIIKGIGAFTRIGWSDGRNQAWMYGDVDETASAGLSINGAFWHRANDTIGVGGILNGISRIHQQYLEDGGQGILAGDGKLSYALEQATELYYDFGIWKTIHGTLDYQFVNHPAFNRDRGPVSALGARVHWEF